MKPFNLDEYLANPYRKVVTRDGRNARIICTDAKGKYPIVALIENSHKNPHNNTEYPSLLTKEGKYASDMQHPDDIFFATKKHKGWVNISIDGGGSRSVIDSHIFNSKEDAEKDCKDCDCNGYMADYVTTAKIEWKE